MTEPFTKSDFLTAHKYAKKYNVGKEKVEQMIRRLRGVNMPGTLTPYIIRNRKSHNSGSDYIHPRAEKLIRDMITQDSNQRD